ncbi:histidine--tRNA ligase ['Elaeagnus angustifolia' witches'-broom phytoplasma]|uniref:Histidine--tRNA ligase n=1 Tax='Elaeagnus angustifolia' witches'-broom phytoplasma TaxID=1538355 RepID=A0ABS5V8E4_9MOLU|nr:histidine--tRNA ligase ['Elaeagnus angustifolia' witches'-broom phytoplasma]MCX2955699.1 histidine--tRNA ligase [Candidatus Phytoplasma australiense]
MFSKIKGTYDLMSDKTVCWQKVENHIRTLFAKYHLQEIRTPIIEYRGVFDRAAQHSEMVSKETYTFADKKGRFITLRPEGTAGVIRSYVENKLDKTSQLHKFFYYGPCFRYERPQKGRYRQFHQVGVEILGQSSPFLDVEVIALAYETLKSLGICDITVKINSLGCKTTYNNYLQVFKNYLQTHYQQLCPLCQERFEKNILRIWDCKNCHNEPFLKQAPRIFDHLVEGAKVRFLQVLEGLKQMNVNFELCHDLVRGLDYYTHSVFEIVYNNEQGHQAVLGGGGCYDNLVTLFGGNPSPGIGFALGMERLMSILANHSFCNKNILPSLDAFILVSVPQFFYQGLALATTLRHQGFSADLNYQFLSFSKSLKQALKQQPLYLLILGPKEFDNNQITIKNTDTQQQTTILQKDVVSYFQNNKELN